MFRARLMAALLVLAPLFSSLPPTRAHARSMNVHMTAVSASSHEEAAFREALRHSASAIPLKAEQRIGSAFGLDFLLDPGGKKRLLGGLDAVLQYRCANNLDGFDIQGPEFTAVCLARNVTEDAFVTAALEALADQVASAPIEASPFGFGTKMLLKTATGMLLASTGKDFGSTAWDVGADVLAMAAGKAVDDYLLRGAGDGAEYGVEYWTAKLKEDDATFWSASKTQNTHLGHVTTRVAFLYNPFTHYVVAFFSSGAAPQTAFALSYEVKSDGQALDWDSPVLRTYTIGEPLTAPSPITQAQPQQPNTPVQPVTPPNPPAVSRLATATGYFDVATDGRTLYAAWSGEVAGNYEVFFSKSTDAGATWTPPVNVSESESTSRKPRVLLSGSAVLVSWSESDDHVTLTHTFLRRSVDEGQTFAPAQRLSDVVGDRVGIESGGLQANGNGLVVIALHEVLETGSNYRARGVVRRSVDGGATFEAARVIDGIRLQALAVSGNTVFIAGNSTSNVGGDLAVKRSVDGGASFGPLIQLPAPPRVSANDIKFAFDGARAYVTWLHGKDVYFSRSLDAGQTFSPPVDLSQGLTTSCCYGLAVAGGDVVVVWSAGPVNHEQVYRRHSTDAGTTFAAAENLSNTEGKAIYPVVAAAGNSVHISWQDMPSEGFGVSVSLRSSSDRATSFGPTIPAPPGSAHPRLVTSREGVYYFWGPGPGTVMVQLLAA